MGLLWTPGYWAWRDGLYAWNAGYWGPHVGYYGGVNYGFGYVGVGYAGGYWNGGVFAYNRTVNNFGSVTINNTYNKTVINNVNVTRVSYNGGAGGTTAQPTQQELAAAQDAHTPATAAQAQHQQTASTDKSMLASVNNGKPGRRDLACRSILRTWSDGSKGDEGGCDRSNRRRRSDSQRTRECLAANGQSQRAEDKHHEDERQQGKLQQGGHGQRRSKELPPAHHIGRAAHRLGCASAGEAGPETRRQASFVEDKGARRRADRRS